MTDEIIFKCNQLVDANIILTCNKVWSQDDLSILFERFLNQFDQFSLLERVQGADREEFRLVWQEQHVSLHFECYSESIWLTAEDGVAENVMTLLFKYMSE